MKRKYDNVYEFSIVLEGITPLITRKIQVPETYTFYDFHVAIQDAMGWFDLHLHVFNITNPKTGQKEEIGFPDEEGWGEIEIIPGWKRKISQYFSKNMKKARYIYDFGDNWEHDIQFEGILSRIPGVSYPICIDGQNACPPEDCGGVWGYEDFLNIIKTPDHERYDEMLEWIGQPFDPEEFNKDGILFADPAKRKKLTLI